MGGTGGFEGYGRGRGSAHGVFCPAAAAMEPAPGPQEKYQLITRNLQVPEADGAGGTGGGIGDGSEG